jgi:hypothetical protein
MTINLSRSLLAVMDIRMLWVRGAVQWYVGPERGGGQAAAMATYEKGLALARQRKSPEPDPLMPSWGEPELLMSLAWSNLNGRRQMSPPRRSMQPRRWRSCRTGTTSGTSCCRRYRLGLGAWGLGLEERERFVSDSSRETGRPSS